MDDLSDVFNVEQNLHEIGSGWLTLVQYLSAKHSTVWWHLIGRPSQGSQPLWKSGKTLKRSFQFFSQGKLREFG